MATSLHRVRQNFIYQMEQISPTSTIVGRRFLVVDRLILDEKNGNNPGRARDFVVLWNGSRQDREPTDWYAREALHEYVVRVSYPTALGTESEINDAIAQDRHDLIERLRTQTYFVGYSGSTTTDVGLMRRTRVRDVLDTDGPVWVHTYEFECLIREAL